jgi:hypothetical protein
MATPIRHRIELNAVRELHLVPLLKSLALLGSSGCPLCVFLFMEAFWGVFD